MPPCATCHQTAWSGLVLLPPRSVNTTFELLSERGAPPAPPPLAKPLLVYSGYSSPNKTKTSPHLRAYVRAHKALGYEFHAHTLLDDVLERHCILFNCHRTFTFAGGLPGGEARLVRVAAGLRGVASARHGALALSQTKQLLRRPAVNLANAGVLSLR